MKENQTRRVASINTSTNIPFNNSNTRPAATFNYPSRPYGQHKKSNSKDEDEVADVDLNFKKEKKKKKTKALTAVIMSNAKVIHIHRFRNFYVIIIIMRCWNRKASKGPLQHFRLRLSNTDSVIRWFFFFFFFEFNMLEGKKPRPNSRESQFIVCAQLFRAIDIKFNIRIGMSI